MLPADADAWFLRNAKGLERQHHDCAQDPVMRALSEIRPASVAEIGCANGWRLDAMRRLWDPRVAGVDPSPAAISDGRERYNVPLSLGVADCLPWDSDSFDCVVFGFCLYLCDRADLFRIAYEADRVLRAGGYLVVYDFYATHAHSRPYCHAPGVTTHKMDHSRLWSWHPDYVPWSHAVSAHRGKDPADPDETLAVTVLKKR